MPIYRNEDGNVLEAITTSGFEFARTIAQEQGFDLGAVLLGDKATNPPSVMILDLPAGHVLEPHSHNTHRMEIVLKGSMLTGDGQELRVGDVSLSAPGEVYGPLTAGSEGCMTVEVFADMGGLVPQRADDTSAEGAALMSSIKERTHNSLLS
jgi:anti-sigma factor ChrR (cupin superfamily)